MRLPQLRPCNGTVKTLYWLTLYNIVNMLIMAIIRYSIYNSLIEQDSTITHKHNLEVSDTFRHLISCILEEQYLLFPQY